MKISFLFMLLATLHVSASVYSQSNSFDLVIKDKTLREVFKQIEKESEYRFFYNDEFKDLNRQVSLSVRGKRIDDVLDMLLKDSDVTYKILDNNLIVITPVSTIQHIVSGQVTSVEDGSGIPGVNVLLKGTTQGIVTDIDGRYQIDVPSEGAVLIFSSVGFLRQEIEVGNQSVINVTLEPDIRTLEEIVVTGYMAQRKVDLTGAVSVVDVDEIKNTPSSNPMQALQGRVPGLYIETNGSPTGETGTVLIRGLNTLGNNDPLYIIDGVPTKSAGVFQAMNPNSIASIQVLKDASAASIYGARASNGVIIITTKEAKKEMQIDFNTSMTIQNYSWLNKVDMCNTLERGEILWQASINDGTDPAVHSSLYNYDWHTDGQGIAVLDKVIPVEWIGGDPSYKTKAQVPGTDWQDVAYRNALQTNTNLTISGGSENSATLLGLGYQSNDGIMKYTDYKKLSVRLNTFHTFLNGKLKIGENLQLTKTKETPTGGDLGGPFIPLGKDYSGGNMQSLAVMLQPILPVYKEDGDWAGPLGSGFSDRNNVLHMLYIHRNNKKNNFLAFGNLYAEIKPVKNMTYRSSFGVDYMESYGWWFEEEYVEGFLRKDINSLDVLQEHHISWTWSNTLTYNLTLNKHSLDMLAGMEAIDDNYYSLGGHKEDFAIQDVSYRYLDAGTGSQNSSGTSTGHLLLSYFGKVNYAMSDKYLASATLRYDGSSRFGTSNQFGLFPAFTVGWRINNENFFDVPVFSNLKLRAGIGRVGNQEIGDNARFGLYATNYGTQRDARNVGTAYDLSGAGSGTLPSGFVAIQTENESLKWESTDELNVGVDFGLIDERITGSFDYFARKTKDILIKPPYPGVVGEGGDRWENGATTENKGFEIVLGYRDKVGSNLSYNFTGSISAFHDKIISLPEAVVRAYPGNVEKTILGHSQTSVFGYVTDGIFQNQAEVDGYATQPGKGVGRIKWADLNGDGKIDPLDQDWLGTQLPDFEYGLFGEIGYKNFTFSFFVQGVSGKKVYNSQKGILTLTHAQSGMNYGKATFEGWTQTHTDTDIPAQSLVNNNNETRPSDYLYVNGSYFKLRNLQVTYSFPEPLIQNIKVNRLQIYLLGENLLILMDKKGKDRYFGTDPETANWQYPRPTGITLGLNLTI